jgi:hypothetical protein
MAGAQRFQRIADLHCIFARFAPQAMLKLGGN